jgi:tungstate transport system ATP-binding protein
MDIEIKKLLKRYKDKVVVDIERNIFKSGKIYGIIGENGAGKTTLLKIIAGLEPFERGSIHYNGKSLGESELKRITYLSQTPYMMQTSVYNNIAYPLKIRGKSEAEVGHLVHQIMDEFQITSFKDQLATQLSGGEAQKVALARALIFDPEVVLLDEPTASIDRNTIKTIEEAIIKRNREKKMTVITISHDTDQINRISHEVVLLERGKNYVYSRGNYGK